jgi:hypothetical protein
MRPRVVLGIGKLAWQGLNSSPCGRLGRVVGVRTGTGRWQSLDDAPQAVCQMFLCVVT